MGDQAGRKGEVHVSLTERINAVLGDRSRMDLRDLLPELGLSDAEFASALQAELREFLRLFALRVATRDEVSQRRHVFVRGTPFAQIRRVK